MSVIAEADYWEGEKHYCRHQNDSNFLIAEDIHRKQAVTLRVTQGDVEHNKTKYFQDLASLSRWLHKTGMGQETASGLGAAITPPEMSYKSQIKVGKCVKSII